MNLHHFQGEINKTSIDGRPLFFIYSALLWSKVIFEVTREGIILIKNCIWQWTFYKSYLFCTYYKPVYVTIHFYNSVLSYSITRCHFAQRGLVAHRTVNNCTPFKSLYSPDPFYAGKFFCPYSTVLPKTFTTDTRVATLNLSAILSADFLL